MDTPQLCRTAMFLGCVCCLSYNSYATARQISFKKAIAAKLITVDAISTGGYCGKSLKLALRNNSCREMQVTIDPGLIFRPENQSYQDLVVMGNEAVALAPEGYSEVTLQTFCGKSYAMGPGTNLSYHYWKQGDSDMIRTLNYARSNRVDPYLAQKAVWFFTNDHSISSIYSYDNTEMSENFARYVAGLRHIKLPDYFIDHRLNNRAGQRTVTTDHLKLYTIMHWGANDGYRHMYVTVYKDDGTIYKRIEADQVIDKYGYTVKVQFDPKHDPQGTYLVTLHDDANKIWDRKKVVIDAREYQVPYN